MAKPKKEADTQVVRIGKRDVKISHLSKVYYPSVGFRKGEMIDYYRQMAEAILPYLKDRPLTLKRYPDGVTGEFFYEKQAPFYRPPWMLTAKVKDKKVTEYCVVNDIASLIWVVNLGSIELHPLLCQAKALDRPLVMAFDCDPGAPAGMAECVDVALKLKKLFDSLKLKSFPKTSGGKGLHLYVPLNTAVTFEQTNAFSHAVAMLLEKQHPDKIVSSQKKELRVGKVLVDWSQNSHHKTTVCTYSMRAREKPSVSTPVTWQEIERAAKSKDTSKLIFGPKDVLQRVARQGDLFAEVLTLKQKLPRFAPAAET